MRNLFGLGALVLVLVPSVGRGDTPVAVDASASSTAKGKNDKYAPWRAVDDVTGTAWCEGKADEGAGETLTLRLSQPIKLTRIQLYVGLHGSEREYKDNNVPTRLSAKTAPTLGDPLVQLAAGAEMVSQYDTLVKLDLKTPRTVQVLELGLAGVTRGGKLKVDNSCITDISLVDDTGQPVKFLYAVPPEAMTALPAALTALRAALAACDEAALAKLVKFPLERHVLAEEDSHTEKVKSAKVLARQCKKGSFPKLPDGEAPPSDMTGTGPGRIQLETGGDLMRMDVQWKDGAWRMVAIEGY